MKLNLEAGKTYSFLYNGRNRVCKVEKVFNFLVGGYINGKTVTDGDTLTEVYRSFTIDKLENVKPL